MTNISAKARHTIGIMTIGVFLFAAVSASSAQPLVAGICLLLGLLRAVLLVRQWRWQKQRSERDTAPRAE